MIWEVELGCLAAAPIGPAALRDLANALGGARLELRHGGRALHVRFAVQSDECSAALATSSRELERSGLPVRLYQINAARPVPTPR